MKRSTVFLSALLLMIFGLVAPSAAQPPQGELDMYTVRAEPAQAAQLVREGLDVVATRLVGEDVELDVVLSNAERARLGDRGLRVAPKRNKDGKTQRQLAAEQAASGYHVWRSWDEPGGIRDELYDLAKRNPQLVKLEVLGHTYQGRELIALKVTQAAKEVPDASRPAVLYSSNQHAREWISVEVNRRLLRWYIDRWRANDKSIKDLLKSTELWFVISANPDGYQYTFDNERLWRKNLRDNNNDGQISVGDGVDPNRNFNARFKYDEEGSSSISAGETYRGPSPASEPETQAMQGLLDRIKPKFQSNFHSFGPYILYPQGWQIGTPEADNPIYTALAGTDANPAIPGFDPGISSDELYVTNGETTDYADTANGTVAFTPELNEGCPGCGFVFPDDEALIQAEFEKTLPFDLALARSATRPADPVSPVGMTVKPFYLDQTEVDPENGALAMFDFTFDVSYGDPQEVRVLAKRSLGAVTVKFQINGGTVHSAPTSEWTSGQRYGVGNSNYYRVMRGQVIGTNPGDTVKVWFEGGGAASDSFTYRALAESTNRVLVLAAEDYTGASPVQTPGPHFLSYYTDALAANGVGYDVYDVDARGRTAPDALGVLSHYDAVIWYTGNDIITREPGWGAGNASRLAMEELLQVRDYLNEGGRVLYTGKYAGHQYAPGHGTQRYDPFENKMCSDPAILRRCRALGGSGDGLNDVIEYWFGAGAINEDAGANPAGGLYDVAGIDTPFNGLDWGFNGPGSAANQDHSASFLTTSGLLPVADFPQFRSWPAARYDRPGGPFDPHTGDNYVYSQISDVSYKRLTRTLTVPAGGATLSFWTSYNTEAEWDHVLVEAHTAGQNDWTTLPDLNGHTSQETGQSCPAGWRDLHPHLDHYQTLNADGTCSPTGTTGAWHAASGASSGWQQWRVDLGQFAGRQVEVSIAYVSDWATQGLGVFVDDVEVSTGEGSTSFEDGLGGWAATGPPAGSASNTNNFVRTTAAGFPEGAVVATDATLYFGFGFEGISDVATRNSLMGRAMGYLLR
ncbi:M14 family zinc carboxypeptidase [Micromonospora sp. NPDC005806]|uniref:M14 family metallopeptidase n=1 Tax=Micromonospora sp. NPDC005806 TaxID=3364234 RepID=UPI0036975F1E